MEEINIEYGMPTVDVAMPLLTDRLRSLKEVGCQSSKDHPRLRLDREGRKIAEGYSCPARIDENEWDDKGLRYRGTMVEV